MKNILFTLASLTAVAVAQMEVCQKNCGLDYGKCLIQTFDMEACLKAEASCALDCFKQLTVQTFKSDDSTMDGHVHHHKHHFDAIAVKASSMEVCQKNCGIDYGKCLIQTFDMTQCTKDEASCALDCLKGIAFVAKYDMPVVKKIQNVEGTQEVCQKNCGIDFGKCMIQTFDMAACTKAEAVCALDCLKQVKVEGLTTVQASAMEVCQENCGIDFGKCLIQTFDMVQCTKDEASCALECLKQVKATPVAQKQHHPHVASLKCTACKIAAGKIEGVINKYGCGVSDVAIGGVCETVFGGPEDPVADVCAAGFVTACPSLASWIEGKVFTTEKACHLVRLC